MQQHWVVVGLRCVQLTSNGDCVSRSEPVYFLSLPETIRIGKSSACFFPVGPNLGFIFCVSSFFRLCFFSVLDCV